MTPEQFSRIMGILEDIHCVAALILLCMIPVVGNNIVNGVIAFWRGFLRGFLRGFRDSMRRGSEDEVDDG